MNLREDAEGRRVRDQLIEEHLPLVGYSVNEMSARVPAHVSRAELASAGALALVRAAEAFDASKGVPFARYASLRIRGALVDEPAVHGLGAPWRTPP
ncbi:sigma-70 family RNA polymerase sigma factor [Demequina litorisediminis]|nr:sigma factor [Demequina litorisediminis]